MPFDAARYLRSKKLSLNSDIEAQAHADAFVVKGVERLAVLEDIRDALAVAIKKGQPMEDFARDLAPKLASKGWLGDAPDDQGNYRNIPRRLRLIYDTNVRQAYHAGQWSRIERRKKTMPYLIYRLGPSIEHRRQHVQWAGVALPVDDPFWQIAAPQNGFGCKCRLEQVSGATMNRIQKQGGVMERSIDGGKRFALRRQAPKFKYREVKNKKTGKVERVPQGIDAGFDINQGRYATIRMRQILAERAKSWFESDSSARDAYLAKMSTNQHEQKAFEHFVIRAKAEPSKQSSVGFLTEAEQEAMPKLELDKPVAIDASLISGSKAARHADQKNNLTPEEWMQLPQIIANPDAVYLQENGNFLFVKDLKNGQVIKIAIQPSFKKKDIFHSVRTAFKVRLKNIEGGEKGEKAKKIR